MIKRTSLITHHGRPSFFVALLASVYLISRLRSTGVRVVSEATSGQIARRAIDLVNLERFVGPSIIFRFTPGSRMISVINVVVVVHIITRARAL